MAITTVVGSGIIWNGPAEAVAGAMQMTLLWEEFFCTASFDCATECRLSADRTPNNPKELLCAEDGAGRDGSTEKAAHFEMICP